MPPRPISSRIAYRVPETSGRSAVLWSLATASSVSQRTVGKYDTSVAGATGGRNPARAGP